MIPKKFARTYGRLRCGRRPLHRKLSPSFILYKTLDALLRAGLALVAESERTYTSRR